MTPETMAKFRKNLAKRGISGEYKARVLERDGVKFIQTTLDEDNPRHALLKVLLLRHRPKLMEASKKYKSMVDNEPNFVDDERFTYASQNEKRTSASKGISGVPFEIFVGTILNSKFVTLSELRTIMKDVYEKDIWSYMSKSPETHINNLHDGVTEQIVRS